MTIDSKSRNIPMAHLDAMTVKAIDDAVGSVYEYTDDKPDVDHVRLVTLGVISGIIVLHDTIAEAIEEGMGL